MADHVTATGRKIKWDPFEFLASGKTDYHCKIKETLFIQDLKTGFNVNNSTEKLVPFVFFTAKNFEFLISFPDPL